MFKSFSRSWEYTKLSLKVLNRNRQLLVFPILSGAAALLVLASFGLPLWQTGTLEAWFADETKEQTGTTAMYVTLFFYYLVNYFVIIFFNSALIFSVLRYLEGERVSVGRALGDSMSVVHQIFAWAVVSAVVGVVLNMLERNQKVGQWVSALLGTAWTALTYFVLPVIVVEKAGPVTAVKRSLAILKAHWGTALVGNFSIGLVGFLIMLPLFLLAALLGFIGLQASTNFAMALNLGLAAVLLILGFAANAALGDIFRAILYRHASGQTLPQDIPVRDLQAAFKQKG